MRTTKLALIGILLVVSLFGLTVVVHAQAQAQAQAQDAAFAPLEVGEFRITDFDWRLARRSAAEIDVNPLGWNEK
jgi:hypothetical protein